MDYQAGAIAAARSAAGHPLLSETNPPAGYTKADDITFSVDINGKITVDGKTQTDGTLTMVDKPDTTASSSLKPR